LLDAVRDKANRSNTILTDARLGDMLTEVEARVNRVLRRPEQIVRATVTPVSGFTNLPTGFLEMRSVELLGGSVPIPIKFATLDELDRARAQYRDTVNDARWYGIHGAQVEWVPAFSASNTRLVEWTYYRTLIPLVAPSDSNFLLLAHPDVYVHGMLREVYEFLHDPDKSDRAEERFKAALVDAIDAGRRQEATRGPLIRNFPVIGTPGAPAPRSRTTA
jgi:hypothetical protein